MKRLTQLFSTANKARTLAMGLFLTMLFQLTVLGSQLVSAAYPHWRGEEIKVATVPYDPRSLFRGNYARLNYNFSRLDTNQLGISEEQMKSLRIGDDVYVVLKHVKDRLYEFSHARLTFPDTLSDSERVVHGRVSSRHWWSTGAKRIEFGIEAYFAPKQKALKLQNDLREGGWATLKVTRSGKAALIDVTSNGTSVRAVAR